MMIFADIEYEKSEKYGKDEMDAEQPASPISFLRSTSSRDCSCWRDWTAARGTGLQRTTTSNISPSSNTKSEKAFSI